VDRERLIRRIVDRQDPARNWAAPMAPRLTTDYALIARAADLNTGQTMLVLAGLGEREAQRLWSSRPTRSIWPR
jgi:hypothetical protein